MVKLPLKIAFTTLGCKLNLYETERMRTVLVDAGLESVNFNEIADIYIINTCTVTGRADYKSRQMVRRAIKKNSDAFIITTGCYAEMNPDIFKEIDGVDRIISLRERENITDALADVIKGLRGEEKIRVKRFRGRTRAFVKIQQGCDEECAYCRVRLAWGEPVSRELSDIIDEVRGLVEVGYREVVITGVNVGIYGCDLETDFLTLLKKLVSIEGLLRIRLTSIEPQEITPEIVDFVSQSEKMAKHFHIPLQSGSDDILAKMKRGYSSDDYRRIIEKIVDTIPQAGIGADVMVGFPGERDVDFEKTYNLIENLPLTYLHIFTYSPRPDTLAYSFKDDVPPHLKKARSKELKKLGKEKMISFRRGLLRSTQEVLFERIKGESIVGFSGNYVSVKVKVNSDYQRYLNELLSVEIIEVDGLDIYGRLM